MHRVFIFNEDEIEEVKNVETNTDTDAVNVHNLVVLDKYIKIYNDFLFKNNMCCRENDLIKTRRSTLYVVEAQKHIKESLEKSEILKCVTGYSYSYTDQLKLADYKNFEIVEEGHTVIATNTVRKFGSSACSESYIIFGDVEEKRYYSDVTQYVNKFHRVIELKKNSVVVTYYNNCGNSTCKCYVCPA